MKWLDRYATGYHQWQTFASGQDTTLYRPLGAVENSFDSDGVFHEGRADINIGATFQFRSNFSVADVQRNIILAYTCLRQHHVLLGATATSHLDYMKGGGSHPEQRYLTIERPENVQSAVQQAAKSISFLDGRDGHTDLDDLYIHAQNTARVVDPGSSLSRLIVLPFNTDGASGNSLRVLFVVAHQISDGLTNRRIILRFQDLLNTPTSILEASLPDLIATMQKRLPPAQEDILPTISGSLARRRWYWAITLVLRHVHRPPTSCFANPLLRATPRPPALPSDHTYSTVLDYTQPPTLNAGSITLTLPAIQTRRLHALCREASCSIGAGLFVLVALSMMHMHAIRHPDISTSAREPFAGSFPINPRPFLDPVPEAESCMLAFSSGVVLPFLDPSLPFAPRFRLLIRSAQRQLRRYQKRPPVPPTAGAGTAAHRAAQIQRWAADGAERVMAMNYIDTIERMDAKLPAHLRRGLMPGGTLLPKPQGVLATCGVSSVGKSDPALSGGRYDVRRPLGDGEEAFVADLRDVKQGVRPRDGEFLVGIGGTDEEIGATVSYDACAIDPEWVERWSVVMRGLLDEGEMEKARL